ncbi:Optional hypothetical component of the B12 transporter BtuM [uncultured Candidatus Thioglobus sp.]|nr:Optional hypothetical component of the B12 transporter BtuM [uncultured Candidatus Thioglobus sp.]
MTNQTTKINTIFSVFIMLLLMIATRGHINWLDAYVHLPDFTIPALFIAGVYFRKFWVAFVIILSAVAIDNYAIIEQGVSANCITPAYSVLPLLYYGVFWSAKFITSLAVDDNIVKNIALIIAAVCVEWFAATASYYFFTLTYAKTGWDNFPAYVMQWSVVEIPVVLYWMIAVIISFTLAPRIIPALKLQKSV